MPFTKDELIGLYDKIINGNTNVSSMNVDELNEFGGRLFHLIYTIDYTIKETNTKNADNTFIHLHFIKNVVIHLRDYPQMLTGNKEVYLRNLHYDFNQYHKDILYFLNKLEFNIQP